MTLGKPPSLSLLRLTRDAAHLNAVANHSAVRPWLGGGDGELDLAQVIDSPGVVTMEGEFGGFLLHRIDVGLWEVHSMFLPEGRGGFAREAMLEARRWMFGATDCVELCTKVPDGNGAALGLARAAGFRESFRRDHCWPIEGGDRGVSFQSLTMDRWREIEPCLPQIGIEFHDWLERVLADAGGAHAPHPVDPSHDRAVGAAILSLRSHARKSVAFYNRWACRSGYAPITVISENPITIDVVSGIVRLTDDGPELVSCPLAQ